MKKLLQIQYLCSEPCTLMSSYSIFVAFELVSIAKLFALASHFIGTESGSETLEIIPEEPAAEAFPSTFTNPPQTQGKHRCILILRFLLVFITDMTYGICDVH